MTNQENSSYDGLWTNDWFVCRIVLLAQYITVPSHLYSQLYLQLT